MATARRYSGQDLRLLARRLPGLGFGGVLATTWCLGRRRFFIDFGTLSFVAHWCAPSHWESRVNLASHYPPEVAHALTLPNCILCATFSSATQLEKLATWRVCALFVANELIENWTLWSIFSHLLEWRHKTGLQYARYQSFYLMAHRLHQDFFELTATIDRRSPNGDRNEIANS